MALLTPLIGRMLLALIFLASAFNKITDFQGTLAVMEAKGVPLPALSLLVAILLLLGGGMSVALGYRARWGAGALLLFLAVATPIFHGAVGDPEQMIHLMKNLAIAGGLLILMAHGSGPFSVDSKGPERESGA